MTPEDEARLTAAAIAARDAAYAPYSRFQVGAAVLDAEGRVHAGANVENASYPCGTCAEASAISAMALAGGRRIEAVAVAGPDGPPVTPCGACRQRIREFAGADAPVLICGPSGIVARHTLGELLPASFGPDHLGR